MAVTTYHLRRTGAARAACVDAGTGTVADDDMVVEETEVSASSGRHFNCPLCHATLTGGRAHVVPPDGWGGDD